MVVLAANQIWWTWEVEDVFRKVMNGDKLAMKNYAKQLHSQIDDLVMKIVTPLHKNDRAKYNTVLIIDVHARDITDTLKSTNVSSIYDFTWQQQLRFYYADESTEGGDGNPINVRQIQASLGYGWEYMGCTSRLVITPLTDKCLITITGALHIKLGANPAGPHPGAELKGKDATQDHIMETVPRAK